MCVFIFVSILWCQQAPVWSCANMACCLGTGSRPGGYWTFGSRLAARCCGLHAVARMACVFEHQSVRHRRPGVLGVWLSAFVLCPHAAVRMVLDVLFADTLCVPLFFLYYIAIGFWVPAVLEQDGILFTPWLVCAPRGVVSFPRCLPAPAYVHV